MLPIVIMLCLIQFARLLHPDYPVHRWFFWRYPNYWMLSAAWALSCFSAGHAVLRRVLRSPLPILEHVTTCFATGVLVFFLLMFVGGLAMAYGPVFFVAMPLAMLAAGGVGAFQYLRRLTRHLVHARSRNPRPLRGGQAALWALGVVTVFIYYLPCVVPSHMGYDSAWYHVPLAEHYARLGGIRPLVEGWYPGAIGHLPSLLYCWAFLLPKGRLFDYVEVSAHIEFFTLLMMLPGIPALVRRLVPGARAHVSWVAFFAFPSLWWYDLLIGGDQIAVIWAAPMALAFLRTYPALDRRHGLLLAMAVSGCVLTKFSSIGLIIFPALVIPARMVWLFVRKLREGAGPASAWAACRGGAIVGLAVAALTTPLWAKNWIWYGDPLFPLLHKHLSDHPFSQDAAVYVTAFLRDVHAFQQKTMAENVRATFAAVANHSFQSTDFSAAPYRGSLFTLSCVCLPFVPATRRLWAIAAFANVAVFGWYWQMHQDRYLTAFMPLMAAVIVAVAVLAWRSSIPARVSMMALIVFHTVWGLGVFALGDPLRHYRAFLDFVQTAVSDRKSAGMDSLSGWKLVGDAVPEGSKILIHTLQLHAGIGRPTVSDWPLEQAGISWGRMSSAAEMHRQLKAMGITHLAWNTTNWADDSVAGDLRFYEFAVKYTNPTPVAGVWLGTVPAVSPPEEPVEPTIAFFGCNDHYKAGLYRFSQMTVPNPRREAQPSYPYPIDTFTSATDVNHAVSGAKYVLYTANCGWAQPARLDADFEKIGDRDQHAIYLRRAANPP
jgi:hypothetical protein